MDAWKPSGLLSIQIDPSGFPGWYRARYALQHGDDAFLPSTGGTSEMDAKRTLQELVTQSRLAAAVLKALPTRGRARVPEDAREEVTVLSCLIETTARRRHYIVGSDVRDFLDKIHRPATALLKAMNEGEGLTIAAQLLQKSKRPTLPSAAAISSALWILTHPELLSQFPRRRGRRTRASREETIALAIVESWRTFYASKPSLRKGSQFVRLAAPALRHFRIVKADPVQFLRETIAKERHLVSMPPTPQP